MASALIHLCVAKEVNKTLRVKDEKNFMLGSIAPDISKIVNRLKAESHFATLTNSDIPDINLFLEKYKEELNKEFMLGYLIHLLTDKLWYRKFINEIIDGNSLKLLDGTTLTNVLPEEIKKILYEDYTNINIDLIDLYNIDLSIFYEKFPVQKVSITEIPMDDIQLLIDKMGVIIENSKKENEYIFEINTIKAFITDATNYALKKLMELNII